MCWQDTRMVQLISNLCGPETERHTSKKKSKIQGRYVYEEFITDRPKVIPDYTKKMRGVDVFDQNMSYYPIYRRTKKWTTKMSFYLLQAMLQNAYTLYSKHSPEPEKKRLSHLKFQMKAVEALIDFDPNNWYDDLSTPIKSDEKLPEPE